MELIQRSETNFYMEIEDATGTGTIDVYTVFPGICVAYSDFNLLRYESHYMDNSRMIGVEHCREGKIEWTLENGDFAYIGSGSLRPCYYGKNEGHFEFPMHTYQGVSFSMEFPEAEYGLPAGFPVDCLALKERIMTSENLDLSDHAEASRVFGILYDAQEKTDIHRKLACLQLLLFLDELKWQENTAKPLYFPRAQVEHIKEIEHFLTAHLDQRYTLKELSQTFDLPVNTIRRCYSGVFGCSVAAYMKKYRMEEAMARLGSGTEKISQIAASLGYENASKFSEAFRAHTGMSPQHYRDQY